MGRVRLEDLDQEPDGRRRSPSARRNRDEIRSVLREQIAADATVLEVASGTGEHAVHLARAIPEVTWLPSERDREGLASIAAWRAHADCPNLLAPVEFDIAATPWDTAAWPVQRFDAVVAINLLHIAPWSTARSLVAGATAVLRPRGKLFVYGAFFCADRPTAPSNLAFDERLRSTDPDYGVRHIESVAAVASANGLLPAPPIAMPNNNFALLFQRT